MKKVTMFPGQGSQYKGMGKALFSKYKAETQLASDILQYDLEELCVRDPNRELVKTQFTQPALYVVNYFRYKELNIVPDYAIGHSLGEYNALLAAGGFSFETGLKMVQKRGQLMAAASGGSMAAVLGINIEALKEKMNSSEYADLDIANYNTPTQTVISGPGDSIKNIVKNFSAQDIRIIPLQVSAPFHSRYMEPAAKEFSEFLKGFHFEALKIPVISNVTARPYKDIEIADLLSQQISGSVKWCETIQYLMGKNVEEYQENGRGVLTKMVTEIRKTCNPIIEEEPIETVETSTTTIKEKVIVEESTVEKLGAKLGSIDFRNDYNISYSYVAGSMYRGTASQELVTRMAKAKMLSFLGTGGLTLNQISDEIDTIQSKLETNETYGMNLLHNLNNPDLESQTVDLYLNKGVKNIEASAFMLITEALVHFHVSGLEQKADGSI
ncbi:ACP S-malonyltransferase, partial [Pontimicrobium sp. MEBiC01747]